ncbi:MAG TPA: dihydrofolate reductase [Gaiellaceae bacterium]|nr:dihydrofolate reductase [Gaiellaceae bacterium]
MKLSLVAAVARNGVIGRGGAIPWHISEDVARFKELTTGHTVVMGRRTWDSLPERFRPLPGRRNVVVTRQAGWSAVGAEPAASLQDALELVADGSQVFVIGGAELYAAALPYADELLLTEIDAEIEGDTFFPRWDRRAFEEADRAEGVSADGTRFAFATYRRWASDGESQLSVLGDVTRLLESEHVDYWLFGGWGVDFHAGRITRRHDDIDLAVWLDDVPQIARLLGATGWQHAPEPDEDGGTGYERDRVRLELTYLQQDDDGQVTIPLKHGEATWPDGAFADDRRTIGGVTARVVALSALRTTKASVRDEPEDAAKDLADFAVLSSL